ncbi:SDR family NAD(P)-dependent oxidoreductase [Neptunicoccus cionae]|uniref:Oxidoreductase n=1 Tax=Neptunicoccus cionae TaxID=2035344 RepID=A0A916VPF5_9RHOB|nr:SDR family oxidoreductase [Amylibacter cionae]GGA16497.1 oxidoreductase [Amylibacter cionae]
MRLNFKTALIFGGGQAPSDSEEAPMGNGRATALTFAREGAKVMIADRSIEAARAVADEITAAGGTALPIACDVLEESHIQIAINETLANWGKLDILHNNVGLSIEAGDAPITEIDADAFDHIMRLNLRAMVLAAKHALPVMRHQNSGVIINISSIAATETYPWVGYKAAKAAILALTEQQAIQNAEYGIRAVAIQPGMIDTVMAVDARAKAWDRSRAEVAAERAARVPMKRQGSAQDVANAALFLASGEAGFISGISLRVDGASGCRIG